MAAPFTVLVTGPESSGKTTLARQLAWALDGRYVPEVARDYLTARGGQYGPEDLPKIWQAQAIAITEAITSGASFIVCDTGPEVISIWEEVKYGATSPAVMRGFEQQQFHLTLLCRPDLPWEPDPLREAPDPASRAKLFARYQELLADRNYAEIGGPGRLAQAIRLVTSGQF